MADSTPINLPTDADRPDYTSQAYRAMQVDWTLCDHMKGGTSALRDHAAEYLPRTESESDATWQARVKMTFSENHYEQTISDLVGLVFTEPATLKDDVPPAIAELLTNADGKGTHFNVFLQQLFDTALDGGFAGLLTEYPQVPDPARLSLEDFQALKIRPYWNIVRAANVLSFRTAIVGGVEVLTQIVIAEPREVASGRYGTKCETQWRVYRQAVLSGAALGDVTWELFREVERRGKRAIVSVDEGTIVGPKRIPIAFTYGGQKLGTLYARPFLLGLAWKQLEESQSSSEFAMARYKCNVPTPIFIGRDEDSKGQKVVMGQGLDIPTGGDAKMLEPTGVALETTRQHIQDIQASIRRHGATLQVGAQALTATEAAIAARQRNARLAKAATSLQDAATQALQDIAAFMQNPTAGTILVNTKLADGGWDPLFVAALGEAFDRGALPMELYLHGLFHGELPDDFDAEETALRMLTAALADAAAADDPATGPAKSDPTKRGDDGKPSDAPRRIAADAGAGA